MKGIIKQAITELMTEAEIRAALKKAFYYTTSQDEATKAAAYDDLAYSLRALVHAKRADIYHEEERIWERTKRGKRRGVSAIKGE